MVADCLLLSRHFSSNKVIDMNFEIGGRKAIICGSIQRLKKGRALALAEAGLSLVVNGRNTPTLDGTANEIRQSTSVLIAPVAADISTSNGRAAFPAGRARTVAHRNVTINNLLPRLRRHGTSSRGFRCFRQTHSGLRKRNCRTMENYCSGEAILQCGGVRADLCLSV